MSGLAWRSGLMIGGTALVAAALLAVTGPAPSRAQDGSAPIELRCVQTDAAGRCRRCVGDVTLRGSLAHEPGITTRFFCRNMVAAARYGATASGRLQFTNPGSAGAGGNARVRLQLDGSGGSAGAKEEQLLVSIDANGNAGKPFSLRIIPRSIGTPTWLTGHLSAYECGDVRAGAPGCQTMPTARVEVCVESACS